MTMNDLKKTPFYALHRNLGARFVPFGNWSLPLQFSRIKEEHLAVRKKAGIFDVSHMGNLIIQGPQAANLSSRALTCDPAGLKPGKALYGCLLNDSGGIIDDLIIYRLQEERFHIIVNATRISQDLNRLRQIREEENLTDCRIIDESSSTMILAVQGPLAKHLISPDLRDKKTFTEMKPFSVMETEWHGIPCMAACTGYTGEEGVEFCIPSENASALEPIILDLIQNRGLLPCGLAARDSLRLEKCYLLYGQDMNETTSPLESGLSWTVNWNHDFRGKESIKTKEKKTELVAFSMKENRLPRPGYEIVSPDKNLLGKVTSGGMSFVLDKGVGLARVPFGKLKKGDKIGIMIRGSAASAEVVKKPFI